MALLHLQLRRRKTCPPDIEQRPNHDQPLSATLTLTRHAACHRLPPPHQSRKPTNTAIAAATLPKLVLRLVDPPVNGLAVGLAFAVDDGAPVHMGVVALYPGAVGKWALGDWGGCVAGLAFAVDDGAPVQMGVVALYPEAVGKWTLGDSGGCVT